MEAKKETSSRAVGKEFEDLAAKYLRENGYVILERNYRIRRGEIDIIAKKDGVLTAFEVKYRATTTFGPPSMAVTRTKQKRISLTFAHYLFKNRLSFDQPCRFDVLGITPNGGIKHIENAFFYIE